MAQVIITVDLGYGDSGKGTMVDALARHTPTELVVRYSGGAQCGHNVMTDTGLHHTFSQFGSGTLIPGVKTYLGSEVLADPFRLGLENDFLQRKGITDALSRITVDKNAPLITEFNVAINQTREFLRTNRHGSCGLGIWETRKDSLEYGEAMLRAEDTQNLDKAKEKLLFFREIKKKVLKEEFPEYFGGAQVSPQAEKAYRIFVDDRFIEETLGMYKKFAETVTIGDPGVIAAALATGKQILFEASQGVMIDDLHGFLPHVTGSDVTTAPVHRLLNAIDAKAETYTLGITRAYMARHGAGPFMTEDKELDSKIHEIHNSSSHEWQGAFRLGWLDPIALRYAMRATGGVDGLAVTCIDHALTLSTYKYATSYTTRDGQTVSEIQTQTGKTDEQRIELTKEVFGYTPNYASHEPQKELILETIATTCNTPVVATSQGKTSSDKELFLPA